MSVRLFGTDGMRGRVNRYPMTPEVALRLGAWPLARSIGTRTDAAA